MRRAIVLLVLLAAVATVLCDLWEEDQINNKEIFYADLGYPGPLSSIPCEVCKMSVQSAISCVDATRTPTDCLKNPENACGADSTTSVFEDTKSDTKSLKPLEYRQCRELFRYKSPQRLLKQGHKWESSGTHRWNEHFCNDWCDSQEIIAKTERVQRGNTARIAALFNRKPEQPATQSSRPHHHSAPKSRTPTVATGKRTIGQKPTTSDTTKSM